MSIKNNDSAVNRLKLIFPLLLIILPFVIKSRYYQDIIVLTFLWAGLASSWNLTCGYSRRFSTGHGAFLGIGAYTSTLLYINFNITPWIGMIVGGLISMVAAMLLGSITLRLKGTFFVLTTISFAEILRIFFVNARGLTGGSMGLSIPYSEGLGNLCWNAKEPFAVICWVYMVMMLLICSKLEKSKVGYQLIAVGQDRDAAETLGVNSTKVLVLAYVASAFFTSIGGSLFAQYIMYIEPNTVMGMSQTSTQFIMIAFIGGVGTAFGPLLGAMIIIPLTTLLRGTFSNISGLHGAVFGVVLLLVILVKPEGLIMPVRKAVNILLGNIAAAREQREKGAAD